MPHLLPLSHHYRLPKKKLSQIGDDDYSSLFPPHYSGYDQSVIRSLTTRLDVGKLERAKARVNLTLHHFSLNLNPNAVAEHGHRIGVMDNVDLDPFLTMGVGIRVNVLKVLARLLVTHYCHNTFKVCVKGMVYGPDPQQVETPNGAVMSVYDNFHQFPFVESKVLFFKSRWGQTKFKKRSGTVTTTQELVKLMFCVTLVPVSSGPPVFKIERIKGSGWKNDIPGLVYEHIVGSFLNVMQKKMQEQISSNTDFDVQDITGDRGFDPFSIEEWHDVIGQVYVEFVTNGNSNEQAIVYRTSPSKRNKNLGEYCIFNYSQYPLSSIPVENRRVPVIAPQGDKKGHSMSERFWSPLCDVEHIILASDGTQKLSFTISLSVVLVGSLLLKLEPRILGAVDKITVTKLHKEKVYGMQITPDHKVSELFPDFNLFSQFVKNKERTIWKFKESPYAHMKEMEKQKHEAKVSLCLNFQFDPQNDVINGEIDAQIKHAISERKLIPILKQGMLGMNTCYVNFLLTMRTNYLLCVKNNLEEEMVRNPIASHCKASQEVSDLWRGRKGDPNFVLPFLVSSDYDLSSEDGE
jgi:hypothetical protein